MIHGGEYFDAAWTASSSTYIYFPDDQSMIKVADLTYGIKNSRLLVVDDEVWAFGGATFAVGGSSSSIGQPFGEVWKILPAEGAAWTYVGTMGTGEAPGWAPMVAKIN